MNINTFRHDFKRLNGVYATPQIVLFRKPLELYNLETKEVIAEFDSLDEALAYEIDGITLEKRVSDWTSIAFPSLSGGRGGGKGGGGYSGGFPEGSHKGKDGSKADFPARMNVKVNINHSYSDMLKAFTETHGSAEKEHGVVVDEYGFTTKYVHGNKGYITGLLEGSSKGMVIHNHPSSGWPVFSKADVVNTALSARKGIVAVSTKEGRTEETAKYAGTYTFVKGQHFDTAGFVKAVNTARISGKDLNSATHSWLKRNQKKFGYKYTFEKA